MTSTDPLTPKHTGPSGVAEHEECWTLVPDDLAASGWATVFEDGSFTRSWTPGLV